MKTWIDFDSAPVFAIPLRDEVDGRQFCEGMLIEGPQGWGEFSPPPDCAPERAARWLTAAIEVGTVGWPDPVRGRVPVAVIVPEVSPERARQLVAESGCHTAAVWVSGSLPDDLARVAAVRQALGPSGGIRCMAGGRWDVDTAVSAIADLDNAGGGLEFVEHPCRTFDDLSALRRRVAVRIAVDPAAAGAGSMGTLPADCADLAVLRVGALGGVRRALRVAETTALPCLAATDLATSIGIASALALAGVLPDIGFASALAGALLLSGDVVSDARALIPVDGHLPVAPMPPGPNLKRLQEFAPSDEEASRTWRALLDATRDYI